MSITITPCSGIYRLKAEQLLHTDLETAWKFFSSPKNLQTITPQDMGFKITSGGEGNIYPGKIISYRINILPFFSTGWVTEIVHCVPPQFFVDEQRSGPYTIWHHEHHFKEIGNGVLMTDMVTYKLPLGIAGNIVAGRLIRKKLVSIFNYRKKVLDNLFTS